MNNNIATLTNIVNTFFCKEIIDQAQNRLNEQNVVECAKAIKDMIEKGNKIKSPDEMVASILLAIDLINIENMANNNVDFYR